jgi:S1-C subfamily serine protease
MLLSAAAIQAQKVGDFQGAILSLAPTAEDAVIPITARSTGDWSKDAQRFTVVVGTGFLIDRNGHFVTAAHVVNVKQIDGIDVRLTATIRQRSGDGVGQAFKVVELDPDHDLALCQIEEFKVYSPTQSPITKSMKAEAAKPLPPGTTRLDATHPFASLQIASSPTTTGRLVLVSGFPLGSWTPTVQLGLIAATSTRYPPPAPPLTVKDGRDLLQISVSANHGNSGGPIIDLATGEVIGVLLQLVPAPLAIGGQLHYDAGTFEMSGLMLAAPATWMNALLAKNGVQSEGVRSGKLVIW